MGSSLPNQYNDKPYSYLRQSVGQQQPTEEMNAMDSKSVGSKAPVTSAYPSPADEPINSFSAPSSPLFSHPQYNMSTNSESKPTLPPLRSVVQIPSPSSSPQMAPASRRSMPPINDLFNHHTTTNDQTTPRAGTYESALEHPGDAPLFPESRNTLPPLFATLPLSVPSLSTTAQAPVQIKPKRLKKAIAFRSPSLEPDAEMYGDKDGIMKKCHDFPDYWIPKIYGNGWHPSSPKNTTENPRVPSPPNAPRRPSRDGAGPSSQKTGSKRTRSDSALDMPPPKRQTRESQGPQTSTSPGNAPLLDAPVRKRVRRPQDPNKPKVTRAPSEKIERNYNVYTDYCPPLSTLDSDDVSFPNIDWKAAPQDMSSHPDAHLLHPKELAVASKLVLAPSVYVYIKRRFFHNRLQYARRDATFNINAAQLACKGPDEFNITGIDVNKTSRLHKAFQKVGWLDDHHMQRFL